MAPLLQKRLRPAPAAIKGEAIASGSGAGKHEKRTGVRWAAAGREGGTTDATIAPSTGSVIVDTNWLLALAAGVGIAAACGLRAFLPLLFLGAADRLGLIHLRSGAQWLATDPALLALGIATVLEIAADKIPVLDHALDAVATVLRPTAAWIGAFAVLGQWPSPWGQFVALVLASLTLGVHALKSTVRVGSTVTTVGHANPLLSGAEDLASSLLCWAVIVPVLALLAIALGLWLLLRRRRPRPA